MNPQTKEKLLVILGMLEGARFPLSQEITDSYYHLIENIYDRYKVTLKELNIDIPDFSALDKE